MYTLSLFPVICNPDCAHGVCVANDTCNCGEGYSGDLCDSLGITLCVHVFVVVFVCSHYL